MPVWFGLILSDRDNLIAMRSQAKIKDPRVIRNKLKELRELEQSGVKTFKNDSERMQYVIGMAKKGKKSVRRIARCAIPILWGEPEKSGKLPRMRFDLDEAEEILKELKEQEKEREL